MQNLESPSFFFSFTGANIPVEKKEAEYTLLMERMTVRQLQRFKASLIALHH